MVTITTTNYKGKKFNGKWNEKVYASQIDDRPELKRIYIDNERIHITEEEYAQMRQRIYRELLAEKDAIMEAVRRQLAEEENQGETHEHQVFQPNTGSEKDREQPEKTAEKTG